MSYSKLCLVMTGWFSVLGSRLKPPCLPNAGDALHGLHLAQGRLSLGLWWSITPSLLEEWGILQHGTATPLYKDISFQTLISSLFSILKFYLRSVRGSKNQATSLQIISVNVAGSISPIFTWVWHLLNWHPGLDCGRKRLLLTSWSWCQLVGGLSSFEYLGYFLTFSFFTN